MPKRSMTRLTKRIVEAARPGTFVWDAEVSGFGVRVTATGTKSFIVQYRTSGTRQGRFAFGRYPTLTVEQARERAKEELRKEDPTQARRALRAAPTLKDLAEEYCGPYATARNLKASTVRDARTVLRLVLPTLGPRKVSELSTQELRKVHGDARSEAGIYQANRLLAVLGKMFSLAIERGLRTDNPSKGIRKFNEDQRWRNLSDSEVGRLLDACGDYVVEIDGANASDAVRLLLFTGARLREVLSAEWSHFDLEVGLWEKPSAHTKQNRQHRLELMGPALDLLRDMRIRDCDGRYLFPGKPLLGPDGKCPVVKPRADLKRPWAWIARRAALEKVRLHDLRRTTASFMLSDGASLATVGKALGHTQASTTARYAHLARSVQGEALGSAGLRMAALKGTAKKAEVVAIHAGRNR